MIILKTKRVGDDVYKDLLEKSQYVDWYEGKRKEKFVLFSKSGFTQRMMDLARKDGVLLIHKDKVVS